MQTCHLSQYYTSPIQHCFRKDTCTHIYMYPVFFFQFTYYPLLFAELVSTVQPSQQPTQATPTESKKTVADQQPQQSHRQRPNRFSHTFPEPRLHRHSSHSPSHTSPTSHHSRGPQSDPILRRSPHASITYGTMTEPRPTTPTSVTYSCESEALVPHDGEEGEQTTDGRRKGRSCCRTM